MSVVTGEQRFKTCSNLKSFHRLLKKLLTNNSDHTAHLTDYPLRRFLASFTDKYNSLFSYLNTLSPIPLPLYGNTLHCFNVTMGYSYIQFISVGLQCSSLPRPYPQCHPAKSNLHLACVSHGVVVFEIVSVYNVKSRGRRHTPCPTAAAMLCSAPCWPASKNRKHRAADTEPRTYLQKDKYQCHSVWYKVLKSHSE